MSIDFDSDYIFLYKNKLYKQLIANGIVFFEIYFNFRHYVFIPGMYIEIEYEDYDEIVLLPNTTEIIVQYINPYLN